MATVLPGSPPSFSKNDIEGTVKSLCNYTRTLQENIDFTLGQLKKEMSAAQRELESLKDTISALQKTVSTLGTNYNQLAARVTALEQKSN